MSLTVTPTLSTVFVTVRAFLLSIVPAGTIVLKGPVNRTAQPVGDHIIITPTLGKRLRTAQYTDDPIAGTTAIDEGRQLEIQIDCYGGTLAPDWAVIIETLWRSEVAVAAMTPYDPLFTESARQIPLVTGEEQWLERWMVAAKSQYNPVVSTPQQFATTLTVVTKNVDETYPPT